MTTNPYILPIEVFIFYYFDTEKISTEPALSDDHFLFVKSYSWIIFPELIKSIAQILTLWPLIWKFNRNCLSNGPLGRVWSKIDHSFFIRLKISMFQTDRPVKGWSWPPIRTICVEFSWNIIWPPRSEIKDGSFSNRF